MALAAVTIIATVALTRDDAFSGKVTDIAGVADYRTSDRGPPTRNHTQSTFTYQQSPPARTVLWRRWPATRPMLVYALEFAGRATELAEATGIRCTTPAACPPSAAIMAATRRRGPRQGRYHETKPSSCPA